jgi:Zn-dependent M28 family amino/carboxypeptidase
MSKPISTDEMPGRLFRHVDMLASVIGIRHPLKSGTMVATAAYIHQELAALGLEISREAFIAGNQSVDNVIATIPGSRSSDVVILGAHYDSTPTTPGADDNASAVGVLIETARELVSLKPGCTVRLIAFACEEAPYFHTAEMGSLVHAQGCRTRGETVRGMLCLEMVGYYVDQPESQLVPPGIPPWLRWLFPSSGNFLAAVGNPRSWWLCWKFRRGFRRGSRLPLFSIVLPERIPEIQLSDQSAFWVNGFPALMLTDTSFLRNPHYHRMSDTPDTLDYQRMAEVTRGVAAAVRHLSR